MTMADEWVVTWPVVEACARIGVWPMMPTQEQRRFSNQKAAVMFVMEDLEESRKPSALLSKMDGSIRFDFDAIKEMYATYGGGN
jgi:hypothetical protein